MVPVKPPLPSWIRLLLPLTVPGEVMATSPPVLPATIVLLSISVPW
jgi:hypothetical protein